MTGLRLILLLLCPLMLGTVQAQPARLVAGAAPTESLDVRQADARIWQIFAAQAVDHYDEAVHLYLSLLARLDDDVSMEEAAILLKHLRTTVMVLPQSIRSEMKLDQPLAPGALDGLPDDTGARLVRWWRRQDSLPATAIHERLEEHLARIQYATRTYADSTDPRGFDDRGAIYIRLGESSKTVSIHLDELVKAFDLDAPFQPPDLPENELWLYRHVDREVYYLFIRESSRKPYRIGAPSELIPGELRLGMGGRNRRAQQRTQVLLQVMEEVYAQLALQLESFGALYDQVTTYRALPVPEEHPEQFVRRALAQAETEGMLAERRRDERAPPAYSGLFASAEKLAVAMRWARFLDPDGTTRTELYWGLDVQAMEPSRRLVRHLRKQGHEPSNAYLLSLSVAQLRSDYRSRGINRKHYLIPTDAAGGRSVQSFMVHGDTATYHLALEWDQRWTQVNPGRAEAVEPGARLKVNTVYVDTLQALNGHGRQLEMSDLKVLLPTPPGDVEGGTPYPFQHLTPARPLALYFELYHLTFGADDETRYTVEYEVARRPPPGKLLRRRTGDAQTTARTSYSGDSRIAREYVVLDLRAWENESAIDVTVRVTDEVTGQQVTRTVSFTRSS